MTGHPGAIVLIVFYTLKHSRLVGSPFTAKQLFNRLQRLREDPHHSRIILGFTAVYMKHHRKMYPQTLESAESLDSWLRLHVDRKKVFWFRLSRWGFLLKPEHRKRLERYMPRPLRKGDGSGE